MEQSLSSRNNIFLCVARNYLTKSLCVALFIYTYTCTILHLQWLFRYLYGFSLRRSFLHNHLSQSRDAPVGFGAHDETSSRVTHVEDLSNSLACRRGIRVDAYQIIYVIRQRSVSHCSRQSWQTFHTSHLSTCLRALRTFEWPISDNENKQGQHCEEYV